MKKTAKIIAWIVGGAFLCAYLTILLPICLMGYGLGIGLSLMRACVATTYEISYKLNEDGESYALSSVGSNLDEVEIPAEYNGKPVTRIANYAFIHQVFMGSDYGSRLTALTLPASVTTVEEYAFSSSGRIDKLYYGGTLAQWYAISFGSSPLGETTDLYIENELLTDFSVPEGVTEIGGYLFYGYSHFDRIVVPERVSSIGNCAFRACRNLTAVSLPHSLTKIGAYAFGSCESLTEVIYCGTREEWEAVGKEGRWDYNIRGYVVRCTDGIYGENV